MLFFHLCVLIISLTKIHTTNTAKNLRNQNSLNLFDNVKIIGDSNYRRWKREIYKNGKHYIPNDVEIIDPNRIPEDEDDIDDIDSNSDIDKNDKPIYTVYDDICHICTKEKTVTVPFVEINLRPEGLSFVHGKVYGYEKKTEIIYECCTGWKNNSIGCCNEPICNQKCIDGEICVRPDKCECPQGKICKKDNNFCEKLNPCDHICHNMDISYICFCRTGYTLSNDQHSCIPDNENFNSDEEKHEISYGHRLNTIEKMIENNKNATIDLNRKLRQMFNVTEYLHNRISVLEKKIDQIHNMENLILANEESGLTKHTNKSEKKTTDKINDNEFY